MMWPREKGKRRIRTRTRKRGRRKTMTKEMKKQIKKESGKHMKLTSEIWSFLDIDVSIKPFIG